ncbi:hypothetical protein HNO88_004242 [Novosphingobium chloroacetimidivorans]|uniref:DUF2029 domain-containing protein n=1 Tax=Novosphingobium chloroacetimidivorans TaxID=1428314 RepID=A0A7W7KEF0_9SPHN|nr:glycosyltransferase family 87 protein [Novosphingobium chloroacetimidivorans]MBB4860896.1 hypothetical protein [Novosphingobium chloroacetimidivorans]
MRTIASSNRLLYALIIAAFFLVLVSAFRFQAPELLGQRKILTDFDAFHITGRLAAEGKIANAYHLSTLVEAQRAMSGTGSFMPWTYPPPFALLMQALARLPIGVAFMLFTAASFAFYLRILHAIAGRWLPGTAMMIMPTLLLNLRTGQNGFLTAGLIGWFLIAFRNRRSAAGLPLGLMVVKPHLAVGITILSVLRRGWGALSIAGLVALGLMGLSSFVYGPSVWADFRDAVREAGGFLLQGYYPFYRMSSVYAALYTMGLGAMMAMALQTLSALLALVLLAKACLSGIPYRHLAALTCCASLFVSPYGYDYDLTILGVALAFVMPDLLNRGRPSEIAGLLLLTWFVCGFGIAWSITTSRGQPGTAVDLDAGNAGLSLISPALLALFWLTMHVCRKRDAGKDEASRRLVAEEGAAKPAVIPMRGERSPD